MSEVWYELTKMKSSEPLLIFSICDAALKNTVLIYIRQPPVCGSGSTGKYSSQRF